MRHAALAGLLAVMAVLPCASRAETVYRCGPAGARTYSQVPCEHPTGQREMTFSDVRSQRARAEGEATQRADRSRADRLEHERLESERHAASRPAASLTSAAARRQPTAPLQRKAPTKPSNRKVSKKAPQGFSERFISPGDASAPSLDQPALRKPVSSLGGVAPDAAAFDASRR